MTTVKSKSSKAAPAAKSKVKFGKAAAGKTSAKTKPQIARPMVSVVAPRGMGGARPR